MWKEDFEYIPVIAAGPANWRVSTDYIDANSKAYFTDQQLISKSQAGDTLP